MLWMDDDIEGDSIGMDVCDIVQAKRERKIEILRARFSALIDAELSYAVENLE